MTKVMVELDEDEAKLFLEFRKRIDFVAPLVGFMETFNYFDLRNSNISIDIDKDGIIQHTAITTHYRR